MGIFSRKYRQEFYTTLFVLAIWLGATFGDIDHIIGEGRTWGHNPWLVLGVFLLGVGITLTSRFYRNGVLKIGKQIEVGFKGNWLI